MNLISRVMKEKISQNISSISGFNFLFLNGGVVTDFILSLFGGKYQIGIFLLYLTNNWLIFALPIRIKMHGVLIDFKVELPKEIVFRMKQEVQNFEMHIDIYPQRSSTPLSSVWVSEFEWYF